MGLHQAPVLKGLIQRLPILLQEQYAYEKVNKTLPNRFFNAIKNKDTKNIQCKLETAQFYRTGFLLHDNSFNPKNGLVCSLIK